MSRIERIESNERLRKAQEEVNPCLNEQRLSLKCLSDHDFHKEQCQQYFDNYNECKRFWTAIKKERHRLDQRPYMPGTAERERILKEKQTKDADTVRKLKEYQQRVQEKVRQ